jgi:signal recognition particle receptor subunit alpha
MIDLFCIFSTGGLILYYKSFTELNFEIINDLIKNILMDEKHNQDYYKPLNGNGIILRWKILNEKQLIFVVAYQESYNVLYTDKLLDLILKDFKENQISKLNHIKNVYFELPNYTKEFTTLLRKWEKYCEDEIENKNQKPKNNILKNSQIQKDNNITNIELQNIQNTGNQNFKLRKNNKIKNQNNTNKENKENKEKKNKKEKRDWGETPRSVDEKTINEYDMSKDNNKKINNIENIKNEQFLGEADPDNLNDDDFNEIEKNSKSNSIFSKLTSKLQNYIGNKTLTEEDLQPIMDQLITLLMEKNVAKEISEKLCENVKKSLLNTKTNSFTTINTTVKNALKESIAKILTPKQELDILRNALSSKQRGDPYKIVFIGVNGVGKSTNLAKVAHMLKKNNMKILIAACDNFRSGAIEQLKTHSNALKVDLFEKGYKDDPAYICKEAIEYAKKNNYDCVLIDTAGRMQDNEPLMKSLSKLVDINQPDSILFVGEALTGNDSVDQLNKFNQALIDYSKSDTKRTIDGIILTKFDTVDDKVGAALTMVYTTGKPIVYVGTGQKYTNLKKLNVDNVLNALFG